MKRGFASVVAAGVLMLAAGVAHAGAVLTFDASTGTSGLNQDQSVGWQFDVLSSITVTGLSWWDEGGDGLDVSHTVGIWDAGGTLLASTLVTNAGTLDGASGFRTVSIAPITLTAGNGYIVGGQNFSNNTERLAGNVTHTFVDSRIRFFDATFSLLNGVFERPTNFSVATTGFYGPSFEVASAVPLPPAALMGLGLLGGVGLIGRLRRRRQAS